MDPVSMVASIVALVEVSAATLSKCYHLISKARKAPKELTKAINEINGLKGILEALEPLVLSSGSPQYSILTSVGPGSQFDSCKAVLTDMQRQLQELDDASSLRNKIKWLTLETKMAEQLKDLESYKRTFLLALAGDTHSVVTEIKSILDDTKVAEKRSNILAWLRAASPDATTNFNAARQNHEPLTGQWLLENATFTSWIGQGGQLLWLKGIPGAGKTVISSTVIDHLQKSAGEDSRIAYYFFDFTNNPKRTALGCLRSLALQLCEQSDVLHESIISVFDSSHGGSCTAKDLTNAIGCMLRDCSRPFVVIDAMDECFRENDERDHFLVALAEIRSTANNARIFISSRAEPDIASAFEGLGAIEICMEQLEVDKDIRLHVRSRLANDKSLKKWNTRIKQQIEDKLATKANGMFRWAVCQLDMLRDRFTERLIRQALEDLPANLDETYERIFASIPPHHEGPVRTIMTLLAFSTRPLTIQEVAEGVAVDTEKELFFEEDRLRHPYDVLELCTSLVTVQGAGSDADVAFEKERGVYLNSKPEFKILQFSHFTVKEFILSDRARQKLPKTLEISVPACHVHIAKLCLVYLLDFNGGKRAREFNHDDYPLLAYSAIHWMQHWNAISLEDKPQVEQLLLRLFDTSKSESLGNYLNLYNPAASESFFQRSDNKVAHKPKNRRAIQFGSALSYACYLGLENITTWILDQNEVKLSIDDLSGAVGAAALGGYSAMVELLLQKGADPNGFSRCYYLDMGSNMIGSSLQAAAFKGDVQSVKLLLNAGASVNQAPTESGTALHVAVRNGHKHVVEALLDGGADVNARAKGGGLILTNAAACGDDSIVLLLLARGADPAVIDGWTYDSPLSAVCAHCSLATVRALLDAGASPKKCNALYEAAERGDVSIMALLLERGADVNRPGGVYGTPLQSSIQSRDLEAFEFLVANGADIQVRGGYNGSALGQAVFSYNLPVAERLLELGARIEDRALIEAIEMNLTDLAETLLNKGANPNTEVPDRDKGNALHFAITEGRDEIVTLLIENEADLNAIEGEYGTALQAAAYEGKEDLVKLLLEHGAELNLKPCGKYGHPLQAAVVGESIEIVRLLIKQGADVNAVGGYYGTALQAATYLQNEEMVNLLLQHQANVNLTGGEFGTALQAALARGNVAMSRLLLESGADVRPPGPTGVTENFRFPIEVAVASNDITLVRMLLDKGAEINCGDASRVLGKAASCPDNTMLEYVLAKGADAARFGGAALRHAVRSPEKIKLLLQNGADVNTIVDSYNGTALQRSISNGTKEAIEVLLDAGADVDLVAGFHGTALQVAIKEGGDAKYLLERGADVNISGGKMYGSALAAAAAQGDEDIFSTLIARGANVRLQAPDSHYGNALQAALHHNHYDFAQELIKRGADIHAPGRYASSLIAASGYGISTEQAELVKKLISLGADLEVKDESRGTALQQAAYADNEAVVQILLEVGADINPDGGEFGNPLQAAVVQNHPSMTKFLLSKGANVNALAGRWGTSLQRAAWQGDDALLEVLLDAGADVNLESGLYGSPLQVLSRHGSMRHFQKFLELEAKVNTKVGWYGSPLQAAAKSASVEKVNLLLKHGADVNLPGGKHGFPLQAAACSHDNNTSVMELLLDAGADVNAEGGRYGSALQAAAYHSQEHVKILLEHGADVNQRGGRFGSPLRAAKAKGLKRVVKLLLENGAKDDGEVTPSSSEVEYPKKPSIYPWLA